MIIKPTNSFYPFIIQALYHSSIVAFPHSPPTTNGLNFKPSPHLGHSESKPDSSQASSGNSKHGDCSGKSPAFFVIFSMVSIIDLEGEKRLPQKGQSAVSGR